MRPHVGGKAAATDPETSRFTRTMINMVGVSPTDLVGPAYAADRARYSTMGLSVCVTAAFACLAMTSAGSLAFGGFSVLYLVAGLLWALYVANLDRWIVSAVDHGTGWRRYARGAGLTTCRLAIAVLIGLAISTPLEMMIFRQEIGVQLDRTWNAEQAQRLSTIRLDPAYDPTTTPEHTALTDAHTARDQAEQKVKDADDALDAELSGRGGSGLNGDGRRSREREMDLADAKQKLVDADAVVTDAQKRYDERAAERATARAAAETAVDEDRAKREAGLIDRVKALHELAADGTVNLMQWLVSALIVLIDVSPVLLKLASPPTLNDRTRGLRADSAAYLTRVRTDVAEREAETEARIRAAVRMAEIRTRASVEMEEIVRAGDLAVRGVRRDHADIVQEQDLKGRPVTMVGVIQALLESGRNLRVIDGGKASRGPRHRAK